MTSELRPWGRLKLVSEEPASERDHIYFYRSVTSVGRNPNRSQAVLDLPFISAIHFIVRLEGEKPNGEPLVKIEDRSRNGIYLNEVRMEEKGIAEIVPNMLIQFTRPGLAIKNVQPHVFRFEVLRDGLTPENTRLRAIRDAAEGPARGTSTPASARATGTPVATTQPLTGKRQRDDVLMLEEMETDMGKTISLAGEEPSPSAKRRRTSDRSGIDDSRELISLNDGLVDRNKQLTEKLSLAADREASLKHTMSLKDREIDTLKDQLLVSEESRMSAESEAHLKGERLADREQEVDRISQENYALRKEIEELKAELVSARAGEAAQATIVDQLKAEREKLDLDMVDMTNQLGQAQTKARQAQDQMKAMYAEKKKLELALDSAQTRSEQVEENKRGVHEEYMVLQSKINGMSKLFKESMKLMARGLRIGEDENSAILPALEELEKLGEPLQYSSEQSQPAPTQENYIGDTQVDEGEDEEQTLDQDSVLARAGTPNPFHASNLSNISIHQNVSLELLDDQQLPISSYSTELSVDETRAENSKSSQSTLSSQSSSKTPPAPPLKRRKLSAPSPEHKEELEESKSEMPDVDAEDEHQNDDDDEEEETALPEEEEEEYGKEGTKKGDAEDDKDEKEDEAEEDKENTPVAPGADDDNSANATTQPRPDQQRWLHLDATNDDDKNEQASASEGIFDDETQLSGGE